MLAVKCWLWRGLEWVLSRRVWGWRCMFWVSPCVFLSVDIVLRYDEADNVSTGYGIGPLLFAPLSEGKSISLRLHLFLSQ